MPEQEVPLDSGILQPHQLSDQECEILLHIEDRLREVERQPELSDKERRKERERQESEATEFQAEPLAVTENRYQRVLLLDGARGTGKTSFILTLINRWHYAADRLGENVEKWELDAAQVKRVLPKAGVATTEAPKNVRVLRNLDFDPLPFRMPVLAAIVQAWRPLVELYDTEAFGGEDSYDEGGGRRLMDSWHSLFRVAATGWSELPRSKGLIEQVLDREEQVKDWQHLREYWLWFVGEVIGAGRRLKSKLQGQGAPVFVIVIDDVDLQVERVRELLPALRLLTHPNVFFVVAAHSQHMVDMLKYDFFGQEQRLAESRSDGLGAVAKERWANELAHAAFEKAFPIRNRWTLGFLTLSKVLDYPPAAVADLAERRTLRNVLNRIRRKRNPLNPSKEDEKRSSNAGDVVAQLARAAKAASFSLQALSYRSTQQLWQTASDPENLDEERASAVLARLVSPDPFTLAEVLNDHTIFMPTLGELAAAYRATAIDPSGQNNVVVSSRPEFLYISPDGSISRMPPSFELTARLIASTLQELSFPVSTATGWEVRRAFVWTEWTRLNAIFAWPWHTHPRPDELLKQTKSWSKYLKSAGAVGEKRKIRERHAYAWVYFERICLPDKSESLSWRGCGQ